MSGRIFLKFFTFVQVLHNGIHNFLILFFFVPTFWPFYFPLFIFVGKSSNGCPMLIVEDYAERVLIGLVLEEDAGLVVEGAQDSDLCLSEELHLDLLLISKR